MAIGDGDRRLVESYLRAMQTGPAGEDVLVELFTDDGVYVEPLTSEEGTVRSHRGKAELRQAFRAGLAWNPPDLRVTLDRLEIEGDNLVSHWTCTSERLPHPMRGSDHMTLRDGRIARLESRLE